LSINEQQDQGHRQKNFQERRANGKRDRKNSKKTKNSTIKPLPEERRHAPLADAHEQDYNSHYLIVKTSSETVNEIGGSQRIFITEFGDEINIWK